MVDVVFVVIVGECCECWVEGLFGELILVYWGWLDDVIVVIEMVFVSGLYLVLCDCCDVMCSSSCGIGELICVVLDVGVWKIIFGFGGSVINDVGVGLLGVFGVCFLVVDGEELVFGGVVLVGLYSFDLGGLDLCLVDVVVEVVVDVDNLLCGLCGVLVVFGLQKGVSVEQVV